MIFCSQERLGSQITNMSLLDTALDWISAVNQGRNEALASLNSLEVGTSLRMNIDGDNVYAMLSCYRSSSVTSDVRMEAHRSYLDIQYMVNGIEQLFVVDTDHAQEIVPYSSEKDVAFYAVSPDMQTIQLGTGSLIVFFPSDAHAPGLAAGQPSVVRKLIIKVRID